MHFFSTGLAGLCKGTRDVTLQFSGPIENIISNIYFLDLLTVENYIFRGTMCVSGMSDEPSLLGQGCQAQAVEDILDKYRNIKRTSPSEGSTPSTYDVPGNLIFLKYLLNSLISLYVS